MIPAKNGFQAQETAHCLKETLQLGIKLFLWLIDTSSGHVTMIVHFFIYHINLCSTHLGFLKNKILRQALLLTNCYTTECQLYSNYELSRNISENFWKIWLFKFFLKKEIYQMSRASNAYIFLPSQNSAVTSLKPHAELL